MTITNEHLPHVEDEVRSIDAGSNPTRFARGWHCLGLAKNFRDGTPHSINAFGHKLVVWADRKDELKVLDAYCRHMGGDLSKGTIKGEEIACPFHDWRWGGDGKCKQIPYARRVPPLARTQTWSTLERNGQLFVWNDPEGSKPTDEVTIPEIEGYGSDQWTDWEWNSVVVEGSHCREIVDNVVDMAHFFYVHLNLPQSFRNIFEGHVATQEMSFLPRGDMRGRDFVNFGDEILTQSYASYFGPSYMINRLVADTGDHPVEAVLINCHYPISPDSFVLQYGVMVKKPAGISNEAAQDMAAEYGQATLATFEQDIAIWKTKSRIDNPLLCEEDGPVYQLRRWYKQFCVDTADISQDMTTRFEFEIDISKPTEYWDEEIERNLANRDEQAAAGSVATGQG
ncbi:Rieske 2Fe-2S domain-containing protein [Rhodococcus sp. H29-C3]|uniref:Rieske 2Fe-2S domain-containing protein n=1 Tax=Rhodococcus sp. H29-C3 TaxID=3046307 RepID=UPI0024B958E7|nr:Rieske 2Fe-2S domain-containing protein [Rhodococcus sp. H29-C3]MDJ0358896.1 Rieske 2Fe-2S domain-containing protein [Rhodococcus sp. H29-C3]